MAENLHRKELSDLELSEAISNLVNTIEKGRQRFPEACDKNCGSQARFKRLVDSMNVKISKLPGYAKEPVRRRNHFLQGRTNEPRTIAAKNTV
jgi:hypothetical protein